MEGISVSEPLEHSVLEVDLHGRPMEGYVGSGTVRAFGS